MSKGFNIDKRAIERMTREIQKEFDRHPVRVPVDTGAQGGASGTSGADAGSAVAVAAACILDWLYTASESSSRYVSLDALLAEREDHPLVSLIRENGEIAVDSLSAADLVNVLNAYGPSMPFMISDAGRRAAVRQIEQRANRLARTVASRESVLHWAYSRGVGDSLDVREMGTTPYGWFCADQFSVEELSQAVDFLASEDFVRGEAATFSLAPEGVRAVEQFGGVVEFQNRPQGAVGLNVVFTGDNNGQLAIGNRDVQQNLARDNDANVLRVYAHAMTEFASLLPEDKREEFNEVASSLEREARKDEPDPAWVKSLIDRAKGLLGTAPEFKNLAEVTRLGLEVFNRTHEG